MKYLENEVKAEVTDQDGVDEMSGEVYSKDRMMHSEVCDLKILIYLLVQCAMFGGARNNFSTFAKV